jgi:ribonuclease D
MTLLTDTQGLEAFCARQKGADFVAVDTEFIRERTYWPVLCLVQVAGPEEAAAIDALAAGVDLQPLFALLADESILKVFHAARQDIEIFFHLSGAIPKPVSDTQLAAMVCGFGDSVSYETLARRLAHTNLDKSLRFTDWAHRPLSERQLHYALADVIHLRTVHERLNALLAKNGRAGWFVEEMDLILDPATYRADPAEAWRRFRLRGHVGRRLLCVLRELAQWRERTAQERNVPRGRILRDEAVLEIASLAPRSVEALARMRSIGKSQAQGKLAGAILEAVRRGLETPEESAAALLPQAEPARERGPLVDLLRVLLKGRSQEVGVAEKLLASAEDLEALAADDKAPVRALCGWRYEIFGRDALLLKHGRLGLTVAGKGVRLVALAAGAAEGET